MSGYIRYGNVCSTRVSGIQSKRSDRILGEYFTAQRGPRNTSILIFTEIFGQGYTCQFKLSFQQQRRCVMRLRFEPDHVYRRLFHGFDGVMPLSLVKQKLHFAWRSLGMGWHWVSWIQVMVTMLRKMRRHGGKLLLLLPCDVKLTLRGVGRNERMVLMMLQIAGFVRVPPDPGSRLDVCLNSYLGLRLPQLCFLVT